MSGNQIQPANDAAVDVYQDAPLQQEWGGGQDAAAPPSSGINIGRIFNALNRFKWLMIVVVLLGAAGGYGATKFIVPEYRVQSNIMLEMGRGGSSIQNGQMLQASGWQDLLRSFRIADPVVNQLVLFVQPANPADSLLFKSFRAGDELIPGDYGLTISGDRYTLTLKPATQAEQGLITDSIGRATGFLWRPDPQLFAGRTEIAFRVKTPREASTELISNLEMGIAEGSNMLRLTYTGSNSALIATTLNAWVEQFVAVATALKKQNVTTYAAILEGQRDYAAGNLLSAEQALERFGVETATQPSDRRSEIAGTARTTNPAFDAYFTDKVLAENYKQDRAAIQRLVDAQAGGSLTKEALLSIPLVANDAAAAGVRSALMELDNREIKLKTLREGMTDKMQPVKDEITAIAKIRNETIPRSVEAFLEQIRIREGNLDARIAASGKDLRDIPSRTIEEQRLQRQVAVADQMYRNLDLEAAKAKLADAATIPDVSVLDTAVAPLSPVKNTAPMIMLGAIGASIGLAFVLAILLDRLDKRFRYPEQATDDLGLFVLGVVPVINMGNKRSNSAADQASQVVEAFRTIRMNVRYAADPARPLTVTVTSPSPNDGKSLIASNLALSFAESGARTLLIDGDIRRGELAKTFGINSKPGLVEYLDGTALIAEVLNPTASHANLTIMPAGARRRRAPELLATPRLNQLINQMASEYDVVVVDSPPLGAGFDAYALATATGNMALVMRAGVTDRKMAAAKMAVVDTLPVRVMGAVLNGIKMTGVYQYYAYYQDYAATDDESPRLSGGEVSNLPARVGRE